MPIRLGNHFATLDLQARQLFVHGEPVKLGARAFDLLLALVECHDRVVSKQELLARVWPGLVVEENNLQVQVMALRKLLGAQTIVTVSGRGYRFALAVDQAAAAPMTVASPDARTAQALLGREALLADVVATLRSSEVQLLTLVGPGGSGKTRLALQAAADLADVFVDGVHTVLLAPVRDVAHLMAALAEALGLRESAALGAAETVRSYLAARQLLLVLDNLEQLPEAGPQILQLLSDCPRLKVLVTSRASWHASQEASFAVPPLALPAGESAAQRLASPAVVLLLRCAAAQGHPIDVHGDGRDLAAAAQICRRLDGLPLAIELVAARLRVLTPGALAARLTLALPLLTSGDATLQPHQRTLRDAMAWSHELLAPGAQRLFARLGVFIGGFGFDAALSIDDVGEAATLDALEQLLDHHLVQRVADLQGEPRYRMLETIREYALERLAASGAFKEVARRHAAQCVARFEPLDRRLRSGQRESALQLLQAERGNLRAALGFSLGAEGVPEAAARLVAALSWWWYFDDAAEEGESWARRCTLLDIPNVLQGRVVLALARACVHAGKVGPGLAAAAEAAERAHQLGDVDTEAQALLLQAIPMAVQSPASADVMMVRCVGLFQTLEQDWDVALATTVLGIVQAWHPGNDVAAMHNLREGRARLRAAGDAWCMATAAHYLALVASRRGEFDLADAYARETLEAAQHSGYGFLVAGAQHHLARIAMHRGNLEAALVWERRSIATAWRLAHLRDVLLQLRWLGCLLWRAGRTDQALPCLLLADGRLDDSVSIAATVSSLAERAEWASALDEAMAGPLADELALRRADLAHADLRDVLQAAGVLGDAAETPAPQGAER